MEGRLSSPLEVNCGVPQGSILGPLLFIIYINDLPLLCSSSVPSLYADDTAIISTGKSPEEVSVKLQSDLDRLYIWFARNKLSVNCLKTHSMLFTSNRSKFKNDKLYLELAGVNICQTTEVKYLGLHLDPQLNFDVHVKKLCQKVNVRTKLLWRVRGFITKDLAFTLYRSLIEPHFVYCNFILEGISQTNLKQLQVQQNCALRAVKRVECYYPTELLFADLNVDNIKVMMMKSTCKFTYKCFYNLCPSVLNDMLVLCINERDLRSNEDLNAVVPRCHTLWAERNFAYRAPIYWNGLPIVLKQSQSLESFKSNIKKYDGLNV